MKEELILVDKVRKKMRKDGTYDSFVEFFLSDFVVQSAVKECSNKKCPAWRPCGCFQNLGEICKNKNNKKFRGVIK
jgi:hypothetical protein